MNKRRENAQHTTFRSPNAGSFTTNEPESPTQVHGDAQGTHSPLARETGHVHESMVLAGLTSRQDLLYFRFLINFHTLCDIFTAQVSYVERSGPRALEIHQEIMSWPRAFHICRFQCDIHILCEHESLS